MKKLVAYVWTKPNVGYMPLLRCVNQNGDIDSSVTETLLSLVSQVSEKSLVCLQSIIEQVESSNREQKSPDKHHFSINSIDVWFRDTKASSTSVVIANEYIDKFSEDDGEPQEFTLNQLKLAIEFWEQFLKRIENGGIESSGNLKCECIFPEY